MVIHKWGYNSLKEVITDLKLVKGHNCTNTMFCKIRMCTARCKKHMVQNSLKKIHIFHHCPRYVIYTLWLFIIAMENGPFTGDDDVPIKTSVYHGFSIAMLNNQMVYIYTRSVQLMFYPKIGCVLLGTSTCRWSHPTVCTGWGPQL